MLKSPTGPHYVVPMEDLSGLYPWVRALIGCPQDPIFHAEGDVWIHTRMVCTELMRLAAWRELEHSDRDLMFSAAMLHDVAKPTTTRMADGRVRSPGHSRKGSRMSRRILWEMGAPFFDREQVCSLILHHQDPFRAINRDDPARLIARISQTADCHFLRQLAEADIRGRICVDQADVLMNIELFEMMAVEMGCHRGPWPFANGKSRFECFRKPDRSIHYQAHDEGGFEVIMMSGLPGVGKDSWIKKNLDLPMVSLDEIRRIHGLSSSGNQSDVVRIAKEQCKDLLRRKQPFVYNATNLTEKIRREWIDLFDDYGASVRIVYIETSPDVQRSQNEGREHVVPAHAIESMLEDWEVPTILEAHHVEHRVQS